MPRKRVRLWPGLLAVALLWIARIGVKAAVPGIPGFALAMQGALVCALMVIVWWAFFSRAPRLERWGGVGLMAAALGLTWLLRHQSMGPLWLLGYVVPILSTVLVVAAAATSRLADRPRRLSLAAAILLASGMWTLARTDGIDGDHVARFGWRWAASPEEQLLAVAREEPQAAASPAPVAAPAPAISAPPAARPAAAPDSVDHTFPRREWPGFRGPQRDGVVRGVRIETDWSRTPPVRLWRRFVGPGWSSFAVREGLVYTQEQRGDDEVVACYRARDGQPVWTHRDRARFFESNAGAGPRATPTVAGERVYSFGATGILNALDATSGARAWSRTVTSDSTATVPYWGFSSSPIVIEDRVVVAAAGQLLAYDVTTGDLRWSGPAAEGYSSPHFATIDGVPQILLVTNAGTTSVQPADGTVLWQHAWGGTPIVQPAVMADGDVLVAPGAASGTRRLHVTRAPVTDAAWRVEERWTSNGLKPYFNDFVVHEGHAFGFDGRILASIDLANGARKWKGGRYGNGQMILLKDQSLLLVLSESGEVVLVPASPDRFAEIARFKALDGKTWNHPVLVGDVLLVRNAVEMAAFRLPSRQP